MNYNTAPNKKQQKILIFHIGHLGDSIMILPALQALQDFFENAELVLFSDKFIGEKRVVARQVFEHSGIIDRFISFPKSKRYNKLFQALSLLLMMPRLRAEKWDALVYLVPSNRSVKQIERDRRIFQLAGIRHIFGMDGFYEVADQQTSVVHEADLILSRLEKDAVPVPAPGNAEFMLYIQDDERQKVSDWFDTQNLKTNGKLLVAFAPGSKMQAKRWSLAKYAQVGKKLLKKYNIVPIVFGGPEDAAMGETLIKSWKSGANAAGQLNVREAAEALRRCGLYIGNDTGTMHLAAAMKTPCAAIFSARDTEGKWHPYGNGHLVFREHIVCQGCLLEACDHKSCLERIGPLTVFRRIEREFSAILQPYRR